MIAILGWGSLLWEDSPEFDRWHDEWCFDGPTLPLEFSRVSETRAGALTLVVDSEFGQATVVAWSRSKRHWLEDAVADLRAREGTTLRRIGKCTLQDESEGGNITIAIRAWAKNRNIEAVVWTALPSNFAEKAGATFSVQAASKYLGSLSPLGKAKAAEYIWRAPDFVRTPLRTAVEVEPWFHGG